MRAVHKSHGRLDSLLHAAIDSGVVEEVEDLLTAGAAVNSFHDGVTAAGRAVRAGDTRVLSVILKYKPNLHHGVCSYSTATDTGTDSDMGTGYGTNVDIYSPYGGYNRGQPYSRLKTQTHKERRLPLLLMASEKGDADIVRLLLQHGADPNESEDVKNCSALHVAAAGGHEDVVRELLQYEAYVNRLDLGSNAALHHAAHRGHLGVTRLLLQDGAAANLPGEHEVFPLHAAAKDKDTYMVKLLLEHGALVYLQDCSGRTALHHAATAGSADITRLLLGAGGGDADCRTDSGQTALGAACEAGHVEVVKALLESRQVHPDNGTGRGATYRLPLQIAAAKGSVDIVRLLLQHGAHINRQDPIHGETALHWAVRHHQTAAILELLQNNAKVNVVGSVCSQTALLLACKLDTHGTFLQVTRLLISHGGNINLTERNTLDTPLHIAARSGGKELVEEFMKQTTFSHSLNAQNAQGETPLMVAASGGHCDVMETLLHAGSHLMMTSLPDADNALHIAIRRRCYRAAFLLIRHGSDINTANMAGERPLPLLVELIGTADSEDLELVKLLSSLVFLGAKCEVKNEVVKSAIRRKMHHDISDVLKETNASLMATMLASLQPMPLFGQCVAAVRGTLLQQSGGSSIMTSISHLPIPALIKQNLALSHGCISKS